MSIAEVSPPPFRQRPQKPVVSVSFPLILGLPRGRARTSVVALACSLWSATIKTAKWCRNWERPYGAPAARYLQISKNLSSKANKMRDAKRWPYDKWRWQWEKTSWMFPCNISTRFCGLPLLCTSDNLSSMVDTCQSELRAYDFMSLLIL